MLNLLQGIERESKNVLELMKEYKEQMKLEEEEEKKSAINGEVENGDEPECKEEKTEKVSI